MTLTALLVIASLSVILNICLLCVRATRHRVLCHIPDKYVTAASSSRKVKPVARHRYGRKSRKTYTTTTSQALVHQQRVRISSYSSTSTSSSSSDLGNDSAVNTTEINTNERGDNSRFVNTATVQSAATGTLAAPQPQPHPPQQTAKHALTSAARPLAAADKQLQLSPDEFAREFDRLDRRAGDRRDKTCEDSSRTAKDRDES